METENTRPLFPWYKERLQTKYLKAQTNKISSVDSCWCFVNMSLDDISDYSSLLSGSRTGISPVIFQEARNPNSGQKPRKCINKEHACFSKQMIQKQIRRDYVSAVEEKLKQHPLAMHPHYKDHMTPELFDKVVSVLDPDMCVNSASALPTPTGHDAEEDDEENFSEPRKEEVEMTKHNEISLNVQKNGNGLEIKRGRSKKVKVNQLSGHKNKKVAGRLFSKWFSSPEDKTEPATLGSFDSGLKESPSPAMPVYVEDAITNYSCQEGSTVTATSRHGSYISKGSESNKAQ